ncbi:MAG: hypothetical protein AAFX06_11320 [Planctomycetota bacterium]
MNRIESQVRSARRRLILGIFGRSVCIALFAALLVATVACAVPGIRPISVDIQTWNVAWIAGTIAVALFGSLAYALTTAPSVDRVALEVDKRFGLNERLSNSMAMVPTDRETDFGIAAIEDAGKKADEIQIAEQFRLEPNKVGWLPLAITPVLVVVLLLVEPVQLSEAGSDSSVDPAVAKQVQRAALQLKKRIEQQKRNADAKGLKEARDLFEKMERDLNKITEKKDTDRKQAMIALNDLKKQLDERRKQLGSSDQMRKAMSQMKSIQSGPADQAAKSIAKGDFGKAQKMVEQLASKLRKGELSDKEKEQLKKQVSQLKDKMEKAIEQQKKKEQDLKDKIEQARREGRTSDAQKMQQQLDQMKQQSQQQQQQMQQMAQQLAQAADAMQQGDSQSAADALEAMADQLGDMQQDMSELKDLESAMNELSQSKEQMRCKSCGGAGCQSCKGMGQGMGQGEGEGDGLGEGSGRGDRPEEEGDTNSYETQVRGQVQKGKSVITGFADGPNRKGVTREDLKNSIESAISEESDPLENQTLPRTERDHARDYFNKLRDEE